MPSFDIVSEVNQVEVRNAIDQANKELGTRFDFKGSDARVEYDGKALTLFADDEFKLRQVTDIVVAKLTRRQVDIRALKYADPEKISGNKVKQAVTVRTGVEQELAKKIVKLLKDSKLKVQAIDPGRRRPRLGREEGDPPGRDRARAQIDHRLPAAIPEFPRLTGATRPPSACGGSIQREVCGKCVACFGGNDRDAGAIFRMIDAHRQRAAAFNAAIIGGVSSKRTKCTDDVFCSFSRSRSSSAIACTARKAFDAYPDAVLDALQLRERARAAPRHPRTRSASSP